MGDNVDLVLKCSESQLGYAKKDAMSLYARWGRTMVGPWGILSIPKVYAEVLTH